MGFFFFSFGEPFSDDSNNVNCITAAKSLEHQRQFYTPKQEAIPLRDRKKNVVISRIHIWDYLVLGSRKY